MTRRLVVLGAGGFARNVLDIVDACNEAGPRWRVVGFVDRGSGGGALLAARGCPRLGSDDVLAALDAEVVVAIADPARRRQLDLHCASLGLRFATIAHPSATVGHGSHFGSGSVLVAGVRVASNVTGGRHVHVNFNSTLGHDVRLGDYVTVFPQCAISGNVTVGDGVVVGSGGVLLPGVRIGEGSTVGAGAVVVGDVRPGATVAGVPARPR